MNIFRKLISTYLKKDEGFTGMTDELFSIAIVNQFIDSGDSILIVTPTLFEANHLFDIISNYTDKALFFPMDDFLTSEAIAASPDLMVTRLETINALCSGHSYIVVTHLMGYLRFLPTPVIYKNNILDFRVNDEISPKVLTEKLYNIGYTRETLVTKTGELGVRGFVIDVFPVGENHPVRFEFFGDTIESIRYFDEDKQMSLEKIDSVCIFPYHEFILDNYQADITYKQKFLPKYSKEVASIIDYLSNPFVIYKDYNQLKLSYQNTMNEVFEYKSSKDSSFKDNYFNEFEKINPKRVGYYLAVDNLVIDTNITKITDFGAKEVLNFNDNVELIQKYLKDNLSLGKIIIICLKDYQIKTFIKYIDIPFLLTDVNNIVTDRINILNIEMTKGFLYNNYIFLTSQDLFKNAVKHKKYQTNFKYSSKIKDLNKLLIGDYVVHNIHGIGLYNGIKTLTKYGMKKDYIELLYQGKDKLYIPVEKIDLISKYSGKEGVSPKVNKLGGIEWQKTKLRVRSKIQDIAKQLLELYADRELKKGFSFSLDNQLQRDFEKEFIYTETADQLSAIKQIKEDMESNKPMDRLLCGDVGYGKTEVAFRAAFKAIMDSKQVLYLCPTTILSNQHYDNALERFSHFPVNIALLNRFTSIKETKKILDSIKNGTIDMVIGTHRLLSNDLVFHDLGLLIIDEEQRFGVIHKEKIKKYKTNIDVLTLTATPIPRTLQMSMVGIRSLSLIETPPVNRYPIQTYVIEENKQIIRDAIYKELSRNGQTFLLYNKVEDMEQQVSYIKDLVPDARVVFAHGQMSKTELEDRMLAFIRHEYDVLICTTIIETGIDIPNVNTLIILNADRFGLSQLYQIRGRVGRSNKIAYAYLMYHPGRILTETALKRLNVIKTFTELGSGFSIATRDLSIRGAGDILGSEQAGFIDTVGIDLYLKILNNEVAILKGEAVGETTDNGMTEKPYFDVETHINDNYVEDTDLKIEIHKKINEIDSYSKLLQIKNELEDRFGRLTENMIIYMYEEWFEKLATTLEIIEVKQTKNFISLVFSEDRSNIIDGEKIFMQANKITPYFRFAMKGPCFEIILDTIKLEKHYIYYLIELLNTL
ncbi:MAG: transcription-repair coupling factor [Bacilli bacterium]